MLQSAIELAKSAHCSSHWSTEHKQWVEQEVYDLCIQNFWMRKKKGNVPPVSPSDHAHV